MPNKGWKSVVLWILVTILLGAVGSGLWEIALKPGGYWSWHAVLTAATFGSKFLKDQVYLEAAKGNHEAIARHSTRILYWFLGMASGAVTSVVVITMRSLRADEESPQRTPTLWTNQRFIRYSMSLMILLLVYSMGAFFVQDLKVNTANELYTYFEQSLNICRPNLSEHQEQVLRSRYSALRTKDEYMQITNELKQIASSNHLNLPEFTPW
jgi:hypothetical protein